MKAFALLALSLITFQAFSAEVKIEDARVRSELLKAVGEISQVRCKNNGTKYKYNDTEMLGFLRGAPAITTLNLFADEASKTTLILRGYVSGTDLLYAISFELGDDLNSIRSMNYMAQMQTKVTKNTGNILRPKYEDMILNDKQMDTFCETVE